MLGYANWTQQQPGICTHWNWKKKQPKKEKNETNWTKKNKKIIKQYRNNQNVALAATALLPSLPFIVTAVQVKKPPFRPPRLSMWPVFVFLTIFCHFGALTICLSLGRRDSIPTYSNQLQKTSVPFSLSFGKEVTLKYFMPIFFVGLFYMLLKLKSIGFSKKKKKRLAQHRAFLSLYYLGP